VARRSCASSPLGVSGCGLSRSHLRGRFAFSAATIDLERDESDERAGRRDQGDPGEDVAHGAPNNCAAPGFSIGQTSQCLSASAQFLARKIKAIQTKTFATEFWLPSSVG